MTSSSSTTATPPTAVDQLAASVPVHSYNPDPGIARIERAADQEAAGGRFALADTLDSLAQGLAAKDVAQGPAPMWHAAAPTRQREA